MKVTKLRTVVSSVKNPDVANGVKVSAAAKINKNALARLEEALKNLQAAAGQFKKKQSAKNTVALIDSARRIILHCSSAAEDIRMAIEGVDEEFQQLDGNGVLSTGSKESNIASKVSEYFDGMGDLIDGLETTINNLDRAETDLQKLVEKAKKFK